MRTLNREQFVAHAHRQIGTARAMLDDHRPGRGGMCSCDKQLPCSIVAACRRTIEHFQGKLALLDATVALPIVDVPQAKPPSLWRRLLGGRR